MFNFLQKKEGPIFVDFSIPVDTIENDILISKNDYKSIIKVSPINTELESYENLSTIADNIKSALCAFRGRIGIYIQSEKADIKDNIDNIELLIEKNNKDNISSEILLEQRKQLEEISKKTRNVLGFYLVIETTEKSLEMAEQTLNDAFICIKSELELSQIYSKQLKKDEILNLLLDKVFYITQNTVVTQTNHDISKISDIKPLQAEIPDTGDYIRIGNRYYMFFSIVDLPHEVNRYRWLKKLFQFQGEINISIILNPTRKDKVIKRLSNSALNYEALAEGSKNLGSREKYITKAESSHNMVKELSKDNVDLFNTNFFISCSARTFDELDSIKVRLAAKMATMQIKYTLIKWREFMPFYNMLPILAKNVLTEKLIYNLTTDDIASIIPFDQAEFMEDKGIIIGENVSSSGIVVCNFRNPNYNNGNMSIIADSGSGKTTFIKTMSLRNLPYVDYTIMFDVKGEYSKLGIRYGKFYEFSADSNIVINPFHIRINSENMKVGRLLNQKIMELIVFFRWIIPDMTPYDESLIENDVRECYRTCNLNIESTSLPTRFCTLDTLDKVINRRLLDDITPLEKERREVIKGILNPYIHGSYSTIFNGQTNWDVDRLTVLDISNLPETVRKPLYDLLLRDVWQFAKKDGTNTHVRKDIYVDEAHEFVDERNPQTFEFLSRKLVKEGRGFGVRTITATQNLADFLGVSKWGQGILDNSYFKFFMKLGENDMQKAKELYKFSQAELNIIRGTTDAKRSVKGKGIFCVAQQKMLVQVTPSKNEWNIIE